MQTVKNLLILADTARCQGLLELETLLHSETYQDTPLIGIGGDLIVDGTEPEIVKSVLENYMLSSTLTNKEFLDNMLIYTAITGIQQGENPRSIVARLGSWFGIEFIEEFQKHMEQSELERDLKVMLAQNKEQLSAFYKTNYLEWLAGVIHYQAIHSILMEVTLPVLERAILGSSMTIIELFLKNLSMHNRQQFFLDIKHMNSLDKNTIERSQKDVIAAIKKLGNGGEIFLYSHTESRLLTKEEINQLLIKEQQDEEKKHEYKRKDVER